MAPAFVQKTDGTLFGGTQTFTATQAYGSNNTAGNLLVAVVSWYNVSRVAPNNVLVTVTDSQGNTWRSIPGRNGGAGNAGAAETLQVWFAVNCKGGANTVTFTFNDGSGGGATYGGAFIGEWSGVNALDNYDIQTNHGTGYGVGTAVQASKSFAAATHDSTELVLAIGQSSSYNTWSVSAPWTLRSRAGNASTDFQIGVADQNAGNGSYEAVFTLTASQNWAVTTVTFYQTDSSPFVQEADHNDGIGTQTATDVFSFNMPNTAGNTLVLNYVWLGQGSTITITGITDTLGNTWTLLSPITLNASTTPPYPTFGQAAYCLNCKGGANTVTVHFSGAGGAYIGATISEWRGSAAASLDATAQQLVTSATPASPSITASAGDLLVGYAVTQDGFVTVTPGAGFTTRTCQVRSTSLQSAFSVAAGNYTNNFTGTPDGTGGTTHLWAIGILAFKPAPTGATVRIAQPVSVTAVNGNGLSLAMTSPTTAGKMPQPTPVAFCDPNGNEYTITGATVGGEIAQPVPVILCDLNGRPALPSITITSGGNSIVVTATLTGRKLGRPTPIVLTDLNGNSTALGAYTFTGASGNPVPCALCDVNGNAISVTLS